MSSNRREFLTTTIAGLMAASFPDVFAIMEATQTLKPELAKVKACVFDVFGTVVDWLSSVVAEATTWGNDFFPRGGSKLVALQKLLELFLTSDAHQQARQRWSRLQQMADRLSQWARQAEEATEMR